MIVLGLLLILAAVAATVFAVIAPAGAEQTIEVSALGFKVLASPLAMFIAGALAVILLGLGFALINRGVRRKASSRKELRELRKGQTDAEAHPVVEEGQHSSRHRLQKNGATGSDTDTKSETGTNSSSESGTKSSD